MTRDAQAPTPDEASPLVRYKGVLRRVLETRPSGTLQRLAEALGTNRSFISQIVNPAYATPIPAQHLEAIFRICHMTPSERSEFLAAYQEAHPGRLETLAEAPRMREITVAIPDFGDAVRNARADALVRALARGLAGVLPSEGEDGA
jgi:transcriptional regulator with XRE-family HTH domain